MTAEKGVEDALRRGQVRARARENDGLEMDGCVRGEGTTDEDVGRAREGGGESRRSWVGWRSGYRSGLGRSIGGVARDANGR